MEMLEWLEHWLNNDSSKLVYILVLILIANIVDFSIGWIKARILPEIKFNSSKAIYGIARKMVLFILLIIFIPFSLLLPREVSLPALYILYTGYLVSELMSIIGHISNGADDKTSDMFFNFLMKYLPTNDKGKGE